MDKIRNLPELEKAFESQPSYLTLEYLYSKNLASPIAVGKPTAQKYEELRARVVDLLYEKLKGDAPTSARDVPFTTVFSVGEMILVSLAKYPEILLEVMQPVYHGDYLASHSLNVAFLACTVGTGMELSYKELTELCVAALLHDIGMTKIDALCYTHDRNLSAEERSLLEQHPKAGWKFFEKLEKEFPWLLRVICEEHLRENGGYGSQKDAAPHPYSRIVGVVDSFESLTHSRIFRKAFHPADAMKAIIEAKSALFSRPVLRALIDSFSLFPVGSVVQLNNKKTALVVEAVHRSPLRPIVRVISEGTSAVAETIDLSKANNVYITGIIYGDQYQIPDKLKLA
jgi:HD-GYP domain-containing protein (c-di-GMP phosphodiesterase class II)